MEKGITGESKFDMKSKELPFEVTRRLLATSEDILLLSGPLPATPLGSVWRWARGLIEPLFLVFHGATRMSGSFGIAMGFSFLMSVLIFLVLAPLGFISSEESKNYGIALWMLLALAITFSKPSRYALTGYSQNDVSCVVERMPDLHACRQELLVAIQSCLQRAEEDTKARLTTIRWFAGSAFALALLLGQKGLDLKDGTLLSYALVPFISAIFVAGLIALHARGTVAIYGLAHSVVHKLEALIASRQQSRSLRARHLVK